MHKHAERTIPVPAHVAWQVMTDHEGYADVAENISRVEVVSGKGVGMRRRCYDQRGRGWSETCVIWDEGRAYSFDVHTSAPDYPYPLHELRGTWRVEPAGDGALVRMEFVARPKWGPLGRLFVRLTQGRLTQVCVTLLERWEHRMRAEL